MSDAINRDEALKAVLKAYRFCGSAADVEAFLAGNELAEESYRAIAALPAAPVTLAQEIDLRAVMMEEIEKAASESPWVPTEYFMSEVVSDVCKFLRSPREVTLAQALEVPEVKRLVEEVENCGFACAAGPLTLCQSWIELKEALQCHR